MAIQHHPHEATLVSYVAGALPAAPALVVGCHLQYCPDCQARVGQLETLGGSLLERSAPAPLSVARRDAVLALLDEAPVQAAPQKARTQIDDGGEIPRLLQPLVSAKRFGDLRWRSVGPGIRHLPVKCGEGSLQLLFIGAGKKMPLHGHRGSELTLVLKGGYSDSLGRFAAGDVADLDSSVEHQPIADDDGDCICLGGLDDKLRFNGWLARLMQPFVGL